MLSNKLKIKQKKKHHFHPISYIAYKLQHQQCWSIGIADRTEVTKHADIVTLISKTEKQFRRHVS